MKTRIAKTILSLTAVAALAVPAVAQARNGSDDPVNHAREKHHRVHHHRNGIEDRHGDGHHGVDDGANHR